ncbi:MAG: hypothetical protein AB7O66_13120 [Limisphaerales bacterium]
MRVVESGNDRVTGRVNHPGSRSGQRAQVCRGTDRCDPVAGDGDRIRLRLRLVHGADRSVEDEQVGNERSPAPHG